MKNLGSSHFHDVSSLTVAGIGIAAASFAPRLLFGQSNFGDSPRHAR